MTRDLLRLGDWLVSKGVTHVAMESTGVYWKPVYNLLEQFELTLFVVNAHRIKQVPGRKTDMKDAEWIAELMSCGLLSASFIPDREQREVRELIRHRRRLIQQRAQAVNRVQHVLEGGNVKLGSVASKVMGVSGRTMIEAMVSGEEDPEVLAEMALGRLREKHDALIEAMLGRMGAHQRFLLSSLLRQIDFLDEEIERLDGEVVERLSPFEEQLALIDTVPGIGRRGAEEILGEIGPDMSRFPTPGHLCSWARMCPGNRESAGKRGSGRTGKANPWLRGILGETAWAAGRTKDTYLNSLYHRIAGRRGKQRAVIAVGHAQLASIHVILSRRVPYKELGNLYFDGRDRNAIARRAVQRLERLGFKVQLEETA